MTSKQRFRGNKYRLQVRERDHNPPHVHLVGAGLDVVINLSTLQADGDWPRDLQQEVMAWVIANHADLMKEWNQWHP